MFFDAVVFDKIKEVLGGRVRIVLSGSAPISSEVLSFLKICFGCDILQGYGMTETSGGTVMTALGDPSSGSIGGPL
jgi:long-chain acyl-CoA synthetase